MTVTDVNDWEPEIEEQEVIPEVSETAIIGTEVYTVKATDKDENGNQEFLYTMKSAEGGADDGDGKHDFLLCPQTYFQMHSYCNYL